MKHSMLVLLLLAAPADAATIDTSVDSDFLAVSVFIWGDAQNAIDEAEILVPWRFAIQSSLDTTGGPDTREVVALEAPDTAWREAELALPDRYRTVDPPFEPPYLELEESDLRFTFRWRFLPGELAELDLTAAERQAYVDRYLHWPTFTPMFGEIELHKTGSLGSWSFVPGWQLPVWAAPHVACDPDAPVCTARVEAFNVTPITFPYGGGVSVRALQAAVPEPRALWNVAMWILALFLMGRCVVGAALHEHVYTGWEDSEWTDRATPR